MDIIQVNSIADGIKKAKTFLYQNVNLQTALFLSGGKTPSELFKQIAKDKKIIPGAVAMVDERPDCSNLAMIKQSGLLKYLQPKNIPFYPIQEGAMVFSEKETALRYEVMVKKLFKGFKTKIAIMGIGSDGHTAGIPVSKSELYTTEELIIFHNQVIGGVKGRISLSFKALSKMDQLLILAFGEDKKSALQQMFESGSETQIPVRFYNRPSIAKKTLLITDQRV